MGKNNNLQDFIVDLSEGIKQKKGYPASQKINPQDFRSEIASIQTGDDTSGDTAVASDILSGKTAHARGMKLTGSIETYDGTFVTNTHKIITNLTNMVADPSNATTIKAGESITLKFIPTGDHIYPYSVTVTGATSQYNHQNGYVYLSNATSDVTITLNATEVGILGGSKITFNSRPAAPSSNVDFYINDSTVQMTNEAYSSYHITHISCDKGTGLLRYDTDKGNLGANGIVYSVSGVIDEDTGKTYAAYEWIVPAAKELKVLYASLAIDQSDLNWLKANATITKL